jgi:glycolate oxidase
MNMDRTKIIRALQAILPDNAVLHEQEDMHPYECDGLSAYRALPMVVALPTTVEQVQAIIKLCYEMNVPVVARGAGTGLSGGALPHAEGVLLGLGKFKQILDINAEQRRYNPACATLRFHRL